MLGPSGPAELRHPARHRPRRGKVRGPDSVTGSRWCWPTSFSVAGLAMLAVAPLRSRPPPTWGLAVAIIVYAVGGGLLEVLVSPSSTLCPPEGGQGRDDEPAALLLLLGPGRGGGWERTLILAQTRRGGLADPAPGPGPSSPWSNLVAFLKVPLPATVPDEHRTGLWDSFSADPAVRAALLPMLCAGAAELTMSQWSSLFAEEGLGVAQQGLGRPGGAVPVRGTDGYRPDRLRPLGRRIPLVPAMAACGALATACYLVCLPAPRPVSA